MSSSTSLISSTLTSTTTPQLQKIIDFLQKNKIPISPHFQKSLYIFNLNLSNYKSVFSTHELKKSTNCYFTIASADINGTKKNIFVKIVDVVVFSDKKQNDFILFDILNHHILNVILANDTNVDSSRVSKYLTTFLSYYKKDALKNYWNFNEIIDYENDETSPYNFKVIANEITTPYNNPCYVYLAEAINGYTIYNCFKTYYDETNEIKKKQFKGYIYNIFHDFSYLYDFIEYLGINYGFMHNDLHFNNILLNLITKKLVIVDFGRSSFGSYYNNIDKNLSSYISRITDKINVKETLFPDPSIINYETVYKNKKIFFENLIAKDAVYGKFPHVVIDLITISANMYLYLKTFFIETKDVSKYDNLIRLFEPLINIESTNFNVLYYKRFSFSTTNNIIDLLKTHNNNIRIIDELEEEETNLKRTYMKLNDGLYFMALLMNFKNKTRVDFGVDKDEYNRSLKNGDDIFFYSFQVSFNNKKDLDLFINYLRRTDLYYNNPNNILKVMNNNYTSESTSVIQQGGNKNKRMLKCYDNNGNVLKRILNTYNCIYG